MMRRIACFGGLFLGTALLAFIVLAPRPAKSAARNVDALGCQQVADNPGTDYFCPVMVEGTTWTVSAFGGAFFDFRCISGHGAEYDLNKYSFTGSWYNDTGFFVCTASNWQEKFTTATNVKTNPSVFDYMWTTTFNVGPLYGVEERFN